MASPLQYGDPPHLGPFVLRARLWAGPAGLVYLGQGPDGRAVSVAVLTRGAALDPAARDRFVTAIREAASGRSGVRGWVARATRGRTALAADAPPRVLGMNGGSAPWVATPYEPSREGAERFLEPVLVRGMLIGERHGPDFAPYWVSDRVPALPGPPKPAPPLTGSRRSVTLAGVALTVLLTLMAVTAWLLLSADGETQAPRRPLPATVFVPTPPPVPGTPDPNRPTVSPSPSPSQSGTGTPSPREGDEDDGAPI